MNHRVSWQRLLAEGAIILASVLAAFWVEAWRTGRDARRLEADMFAAVGQEFQGNIGSARFVVEVSDEQLALVDRFLRSTPGALAGVTRDSVSAWVSALTDFPLAARNTQAAEMLMAAAPTSSSAMEGYRAVSGSFRGGELSELAIQAEPVRQTVRMALIPYAADGTHDGLATLASMVGRQGPAALSALRADYNFVFAVLAKGTLQREYRDALADYAEFLRAYDPRTCVDIGAVFPDTSVARTRNLSRIAETMCQFY